MFTHFFDELYIGVAVNEKQNRLEREAVIRRLLAEAQAQCHDSYSRNEQASFVQLLALALKAPGTNGRMNWKL